jgi:hypothetical protein
MKKALAAGLFEEDAAQGLFASSRRIFYMRKNQTG